MILNLLSPTGPLDFATMMDAFSKMVSRGLAQTASQITSIIQANLAKFRLRIKVTEQKVEQTISTVNQNVSHIFRISWTLQSPKSTTWKTAPGIIILASEVCRKQLRTPTKKSDIL